VLLEGSVQRSLIQAADDSADPASRAQLKEEVLGREVQTELKSRDGGPAFQLLVNMLNDVFVATRADPSPANLPMEKMKWPVDATLRSDGKPVMSYIATPGHLYLVMGIPVHIQVNDAPTDAYFVGFEVDDVWVKGQLLSDRRSSDSTEPPLSAWFVVDGSVAARASADPTDARPNAFGADALAHSRARVANAESGAEPIAFNVAGERYLGQVFPLKGDNSNGAKLVLGSSLDQALTPLHHLQKQIVLIAFVACLVAVLACRFIATLISRPIGELVKGTQRIAAAEFDNPVHIRRNDELGVLAQSFNKMAEGLRERDNLREQRVKLERDMAVARKIQMDVLPKSLPPCAGYDLAACSLPAEQTGGDIYDLVALALDAANPNDPPSMVLLLADATGHGIGPALSVTQVRSMLRIGVRLQAQLEDVFSQINRQLCQDLGSERFVTAFLGLLDTTGHSIDYHSAGQGPLLHFHGLTHRFEWLDTSMLPLGIDEDAMCEAAKKIKVEPGDLIVLLTDGFYECSNMAGDQFGRERIAEIILQHHHRPARELLNELVEATKRFANGAPQEDDMTGVIIGRLTAAD
jgi:serine phosphatase RsbU (regulator of sigma subunit)